MLNTECIAKENTEGRYLGYGTAFTYTRGDEHAGKFPLWHWDMMPFTTVDRDGNVSGTKCEEFSPNSGTYPPSNDGCWANCHSSETQGRTPFVGGVSTGTIGATIVQHVEPRGTLTYRMATLLLPGFHVVVHRGVSKASLGASNLSKVT